MSSNYPPGVTGNEYQISGGYEYVYTVSCGCGFEDEVEVTFESRSRHAIGWWTCPTCNTEHEYEQDDDPYDDYDPTDTTF